MNEELLKELIASVEALGKATFTDWLPIILSVVAAAIAIFIPVRIAKNQNKIALFEMLYAAYSHVLLVKNFASSLNTIEFEEDDDIFRDCSLFSVHFETNFGCRLSLLTFDERVESLGLATAALRRNETQSYMLPLLLSKSADDKEKCSKMLSEIYESLFMLLTEVILFEKGREEIVRLKTEVIEKTTVFFDTYANVIEDNLLCGKLNK